MELALRHDGAQSSVGLAPHRDSRRVLVKLAPPVFATLLGGVGPLCARLSSLQCPAVLTYEYDITMFVLAAFALLSWRGVSAHPNITLSTAQLTATLFLPATPDSYYRSSRFDWGTMIGDLRFEGHRVFPSDFWRQPHDPTWPESGVGLASAWGCGDSGAHCSSGARTAHVQLCWHSLDLPTYVCRARSACCAAQGGVPTQRVRPTACWATRPRVPGRPFSSPCWGRAKEMTTQRTHSTR